MNLLELNYDKKNRGVDGSQGQPDKERDIISYSKLFDFFISNNNYYSNIGKELPFKPEFNISIKKQSKITDFILIGNFTPPFGLLISEKVLSLLQKFNLIPYSVYKASLIKEDDLLEIENYYWFYPLRLSDSIDFKKTFESYSNIPFKIETETDFIKLRENIPIFQKKLNIKYPFNSPEKYLEQQGILKLQTPKIFCLKEDVFQKYDFIGFKYDTFWFVSDRLKDALIENNISGVDFKYIESTRFKYSK